MTHTPIKPGTARFLGLRGDKLRKAPDIVVKNRRYMQNRDVTPHLAWDLDGVSVVSLAGPQPPGHEHWAQTVAMFDERWWVGERLPPEEYGEVWLCPCGSIKERHTGWSEVKSRKARRSWWGTRR